MAIQIMGFSDLGKGVNLEAMPGIYDLTNASAPGNIGYVVSPLRGSTINSSNFHTPNALQSSTTLQQRQPSRNRPPPTLRDQRSRLTSARGGRSRTRTLLCAAPAAAGAAHPHKQNDTAPS